jgi:hypothetical protein
MWRRNVFSALVAEFWQIDAGKKVFSRTEQDRGNSKVQLVDESRTKILPDRGDTAAEPDISAAGSIAGPLKYSMDIIGNEMEYGAALHRDRWPGVVGQHKDLCVVWRIVAPPAFPCIVGPGASDRPEHIAPDDPGANVAEAARRKTVIDIGSAAIIPEHLLKSSGGEDPFVQRHAANAEWIVEILAGACTVAIQGYGEGVHTEFGHGW